MKTIKNWSLFNENNSNEFEILIHKQPYDKTDFGQNKYGVFVKKNNIHYYIGDLRKFDNYREYISYIDVLKVEQKEPTSELVKPNNDQMMEIEEVLNSILLSKYFSGNTTTKRKFLLNKLK
jgi:hypothetical protein